MLKMILKVCNHYDYLFLKKQPMVLFVINKVF